MLHGAVGSVGGRCLLLAQGAKLSNPASTPLLQPLGALGAWPQHLHPLRRSSYHPPPSAVPSQCKGWSFSAGKTCPGGFPSAFSPGHAQITPRLTLGVSKPLFLVSLSWRGQGQPHVLTPGIQRVVLLLVAGCSLSSWDSLSLLVVNLLFAFGARQICPWALLGQAALEPPPPEASSQLFCWHSACVRWDRLGSCRAAPKACQNAVACNGIGILHREMSFHDIGQQT